MRGSGRCARTGRNRTIDEVRMESTNDAWGLGRCDVCCVNAARWANGSRRRIFWEVASVG